MSNEFTQDIPDFLFTPPPPVEFRLYYNNDGTVICYTCENLEGNYIIVDAQTFAEARPDVQVVDGKVTRIIPKTMISKLKPSDSGVTTLKEDVSVVVEEDAEGTQKWDLISHELR